MNTDKAKRLLNKAQALFDNLSDQGTVSSLERDLLLSYLRELYEEVSNPQVTQIKHESIPEPPRVRVEKPVVEMPLPAKPATMHTQPEWNAPSKPIIPEPVHTHVEQVFVPPVKEYVEPVVEYKEKKAPAPEPVTTFRTPLVFSDSHVELSALFEFKETGELGERLKFQPIERIEHGMGINERILAINELFNGDSDLFKKTLDDLNELSSYSDAQGYLMEGVASRFNWSDAARKHKATFFIHLVRRRYARHN